MRVFRQQLLYVIALTWQGLLDTLHVIMLAYEYETAISKMKTVVTKLSTSNAGSCQQKNKYKFCVTEQHGLP